MSILTDRLNYFIDKRKERVSELARRSGIDRATLHQYLSDRRSLKNRAHFYKWKENRTPPGTFSARQLPPWSSTICREMASPRPVPWPVRTSSAR